MSNRKCRYDEEVGCEEGTHDQESTETPLFDVRPVARGQLFCQIIDCSNPLSGGDAAKFYRCAVSERMWEAQVSSPV